MKIENSGTKQKKQPHSQGVGGGGKIDDFGEKLKTQNAQSDIIISENQKPEPLPFEFIIPENYNLSNEEIITLIRALVSTPIDALRAIADGRDKIMPAIAVVVADALIYGDRFGAVESLLNRLIGRPSQVVVMQNNSDVPTDNTEYERIREALRIK